MTRGWGSPVGRDYTVLRAHNEARYWREKVAVLRKKGLRPTILYEWHPWFAWYPVRPFFICGPNRYPKMTGVKMTAGPCIWLRRCWRRRVGRPNNVHGGFYEYRRWVK